PPCGRRRATSWARRWELRSCRLSARPWELLPRARWRESPRAASDRESSSACRPRAGGDPISSLKDMGSRLRGNDDYCRLAEYVRDGVGDVVDVARIEGGDADAAGLDGVDGVFAAQ